MPAQNTKNGLLIGEAILCLVLLVILGLPGFGQTGPTETINAKTYNASNFFSISGEVSGQAAPGVTAVYVNGTSVPVDANRYFQAYVYLRDGQKYLTIETHYPGLRFIKKYLVVRYPKAQKMFRVYVPEQDTRALAEPKPATEEEKTVAVAPPVETTTTTQKIVTKTTLPYETVVPKVSTIKERKAPAPAKVQPVREVTLASKAPVSPKREQPRQPTAAQEKVVQQESVVYIEKNLTRIVEGKTEEIVGKYVESPAGQQLLEKQAQKILEKNISKAAAEKIIASAAKKVVSETAPDIIRIEAKKAVEKVAASEELMKILQKEAPYILERQVEKILERDVPAGEGLKIVEREIQKIVKQETPLIIEREAGKLITNQLTSPAALKKVEQQVAAVVKQKIQTIFNKEALWKILSIEIKREALGLVDRAALWELAKKTVETAAQKVVDKQALWAIAQKSVKTEVLNQIDNGTLRKIVQTTVETELNRIVAGQISDLARGEIASQLKLAAPKSEIPAKPQAQPTLEAQLTLEAQPIIQAEATLKVPSLPFLTAEKPYTLIVELAPGKILLVREDDGIYSGYIYYTKTLTWFSLQEMTYEELKNLLNQNKLPASAGSQNKL